MCAMHTAGTHDQTHVRLLLAFVKAQCQHPSALACRRRSRAALSWVAAALTSVPGELAGLVIELLGHTLENEATAEGDAWC